MKKESPGSLRQRILYGACFNLEIQNTKTT
jgi:RNA-binding protein PNO1